MWIGQGFDQRTAECVEQAKHQQSHRNAKKDAAEKIVGQIVPFPIVFYTPEIRREIPKNERHGIGIAIEVGDRVAQVRSDGTHNQSGKTQVSWAKTSQGKDCCGMGDRQRHRLCLLEGVVLSNERYNSKALWRGGADKSVYQLEFFSVLAN